MPAVIDASVTLPWFLQDERTTFTEAVFSALGKQEYWVPVMWRLEFANALLAAERKKRIDRQTRLEALELAAALALRVDATPVDMKTISALAERHDLSAYDASYLELAQRAGYSLITMDRVLAEAAVAAGIAVQSPGRSAAAQPRKRSAARVA
ncbi:MAG: PIN domain-containing protein [Betaproteobacteria bacterium]|nr:MAG: PIN domain-containing protein [Betaproteobacteria bacterium]